MTRRAELIGSPSEVAGWLRGLGDGWALVSIGFAPGDMERFTKSIPRAPAAEAVVSALGNISIYEDPYIALRPGEVHFTAEQGMSRAKMLELADKISALMGTALLMLALATPGCETASEQFDASDRSDAKSAQCAIAWCRQLCAPRAVRHLNRHPFSCGGDCYCEAPQ